MIAEPACSCTRWVSVISISPKPARLQGSAELGLGERAGDAARPRGHVGAGLLVHVGVGDHVRNGEPAAWTQHAGGLEDHARLVAGKVDHAVGDDDVDRVGIERYVLEVALEELSIVDAGLAGVGARELEHLVGHVQADRRTGRADSAGGDQHVGAGAGPEVQDRLAVM